jgi:predicted TIM-barrel fold metal-dependent hydrolase
MKWTRRQFFGGLALAGGAAAWWALKCDPETKAPRDLVDFHVHLFGAGAGGTGCFISERQKRHPNYRYFLKLLNLREGGSLDEDYVECLLAQLRGSSVRRAVLLAQDCRYDGAGRRDMDRTSFFVPNDHLLRVTAQHSDLFIPCVSINPMRHDAIEELERCAAGGARILKIHPPIQAVDAGDARYRPFYRRCAEMKIIVMVHTGTENASEITGNAAGDPLKLAPALEEGCTVVAAHSGMSAFFECEDFFPGLVDMMRRYPNLYCDSSNLASMFRWRNLPRILEEPRVVDRLIYASDFPFPSNALVFWSRLKPRELLRLLSERNLLERNYRLQRALGLPPAAFERGAKLLAAL